MGKIIFYEKTGCINNAKQKKILTLAGHTVQAVDLIQYPWRSDELLSFFDGLEVSQWFNPNAPKVTSGEVLPNQFNRETALQALIADHLLIKRPLMIVGNHKLVGFDEEVIDSLIGLHASTNHEIKNILKDNIIDCPRKNTGNLCD